jgi:hypothetical protein
MGIEERVNQLVTISACDLVALRDSYMGTLNTFPIALRATTYLWS